MNNSPSPEEDHLYDLLSEWLDTFGPVATLNKLNAILQEFAIQGDEVGQHNVLIIISALKEELGEELN